MGELEYYVIKANDPSFPATDQKGYHETRPFAKANDFRTRCMKLIAECGGRIKYGHSEVGNFTKDGLCYEQNEIEFLPVPADECAYELLVAKWIIRNLGHQEGYNITFSPKIIVGKAGSGMHIHMRIMKDGRNMMLTPERTLSVEARKAIAGMMDLAQSITAFGNKNPMSWLRLVAAPGGPDEHLLGHVQPLRARARAAGMDLGPRHVHGGQPQRAPRGARLHLQADRGDALTGRFCRHLPAPGRPLRGLPPWLRDAQRRGGGRADLRRRRHPRPGECCQACSHEGAARQLRRIGRLPGAATSRL